MPNALTDPDRDHNTDIKLDMIPYTGVAIVWPTGDVVGTVCILERKTNTYDENKSALLFQFKVLIEFCLRSIYEQILLETNQEEKEQEARRCAAYLRRARHHQSSPPVMAPGRHPADRIRDSQLTSPEACGT